MIRIVNKEEKSLATALITLSSPSSSNVPVWVYVIFRKNISSGHNKITVNISKDGPVFWNRHVIYVFCCSCHFDKHERDLTHLLETTRQRVERVCLVDSPVDYPFLSDSLFSYMASALPKLQFVYLRELDLETINRATVDSLAKHPRLKKLVVHNCRNFEALQDFSNLPQLLVVKGEVIGLKAMIGDLGDFSMDSISSSTDAIAAENRPADSVDCNNARPRQCSTASSSSQLVSYSSDDISVEPISNMPTTNRRSPIIFASSTRK